MPWGLNIGMDPIQRKLLGRALPVLLGYALILTACLILLGVP